MSNVILERIHQVIGNLFQTYNITQTYVDKDDSWLGTLAASVFAIHLTINILKGHSLGKFIFVRDMIQLIK